MFLSLDQCSCGREHPVPDITTEIAPGALRRLPELLSELGVTRPFLVMDGNTRIAAGESVEHLLSASGITFQTICLPASPKPEADMTTVEELLHGMGESDFVLGIGSGVINDLCKMLGLKTGLRTGIVATAPSMDGYASNSSAMIVNGVKQTIYNQTPVLAVCDLEILQNAPLVMRGAGIGDMAAKAISIAEWQISHLVTGEYYCEAIAERMLSACRQAIDCAQEIMQGNASAIRGLTDGLLLSGIAMSMAQVSRPASGSEHTLSHLMDMFSIRCGLPHNLHGMQVGYGVRVALAAYETLLSEEDVLQSAVPVSGRHDPAVWEQEMRRVFGDQADALIADAKREDRNTPEALQARADAATAHWEDIRAILRAVIAEKERILAALDAAGVPDLRNPQALGFDAGDILDAFTRARDLRSRYIFPALVFDLGLMPWMRGKLAALLAA